MSEVYFNNDDIKIYFNNSSSFWQLAAATNCDWPTWKKGPSDYIKSKIIKFSINHKGIYKLHSGYCKDVYCKKCDYYNRDEDEYRVQVHQHLNSSYDQIALPIEVKL